MKIKKYLILRTLLTIFIVFTFLVIMEISIIKASSTNKIPIDTPKKDRSWDLDEDKVKDYISTDLRFKDKSKINIIGNASNRKWAVDERYSYMEFIYNNYPIVMIYPAETNNQLI